MTRTRVSGYFSKTAWNATAGRRSTVEGTAALADTVLYGAGWPCCKGRWGKGGAWNEPFSKNRAVSWGLHTYSDDVKDAEQTVDTVSW